MPLILNVLLVYEFYISLLSHLFLLIIRLPPRSILFPYTTLFRSGPAAPIAWAPTGLPRLPGYSASCPGLLSTRSEEHTSELQSRFDLVCRLLLEKKNEYSSSIGQSAKTE